MGVISEDQKDNTGAADGATEAESEAPATAASSQPDAPEDDLKRRFREALDRKRGQHQDGVGADGRGDSKIHGAHGPAKSKRSFRRKSGG